MSDSVKDFLRKYIKYIIFLGIILFILIVILLLGNNKYKKYEKEMISKSKNYFNYSLNYVTIEEMNIKYDGCRSYSGVYRINNEYIPYLFCDKYSSIDELTSKNITLSGPNPIVLNVGEEYVDSGYNSKYNVEIVNSVKPSEGLYFITYRIKDNGKLIDETKRIVIVKGYSKNSFSLKGDSEINIFKGEPYIEAGYVAYDELGNDISSAVTVSGSVNNVSGRYEITYALIRNNIKKELKRIVNVLDLETYIELDSEKPSNSSNKINLIATGKDYSYTILPNGKQDNSREIEYEVSENGTYNFKVYAGNKYILKTIVVNNIYKDLVATCTITQGNNQIFVTVDSSGGYGELEYSYLDKTSYSAYTREKIYYFKNKVKETTVKVKDKAGNIKNISCSNPNIKVSPLEIHFIASGHYDDSILIRSDDKVIYIDGGRSGCKNHDINYLKDLGITKIDYMIGSHVEYDHIQAQAYILDTFQVDRILYPVDIYTCVNTCHCHDSNDNALVLDSLKRNNKKAEMVSIPTKIVAGDMTLYFIAPWNKVCNNNNNSFIFILTYSNNSFMFTGDTYSPLNDITTLTSYAQKLGLKNIDVDMLKYPHHGNSSLSDKVLNAIKPEIVIVPNYNASKYPTETNQKIVKSHGAKMYRQSDSSTGNLTLISDGNNIKVYMNTIAGNYRR